MEIECKFGDVAVDCSETLDSSGRYRSARKPISYTLGKRYICGQQIGTRRVERGKEVIEYRDGNARLSRVEFTDGATVSEVYLGCGTEMLCTKLGEGAPYCCGIPMTEMKPSDLPSSD